MHNSKTRASPESTLTAASAPPSLFTRASPASSSASRALPLKKCACAWRKNSAVTSNSTSKKSATPKPTRRSWPKLCKARLPAACPTAAPPRWRWRKPCSRVQKASRSKCPVVSTARKSRAARPSGRGLFLCRHFVPTCNTRAATRGPPTASSVSKCGSIKEWSSKRCGMRTSLLRKLPPPWLPPNHGSTVPTYGKFHSPYMLEPKKLKYRKQQRARGRYKGKATRGHRLAFGSVSRKAAEVPMGSGKGAPDHFAVVVHQGTMLFEMDGLPEESAREALHLAGYKLPIKTRVVTRIANSLLT